MNESTAAIDIQTTLLVDTFFFPSEFEVSEELGPSACFEGGVLLDGTPGSKNGGDGDDGVDGDVGEGRGALLELKGFPSFLQNKDAYYCDRKHASRKDRLYKRYSTLGAHLKFGMLSIFSGIGPLNRLFSMFLISKLKEIIISQRALP